jgi:anti-anti-sigma regulatory factor
MNYRVIDCYRWNLIKVFGELDLSISPKLSGILERVSRKNAIFDASDVESMDAGCAEFIVAKIGGTCRDRGGELMIVRADKNVREIIEDCMKVPNEHPDLKISFFDSIAEAASTIPVDLSLRV